MAAIHAATRWPSASFRAAMRQRTCDERMMSLSNGSGVSICMAGASAAFQCDSNAARRFATGGRLNRSSSCARRKTTQRAVPFGDSVPASKILPPSTVAVSTLSAALVTSASGPFSPATSQPWGHFATLAGVFSRLLTRKFNASRAWAATGCALVSVNSVTQTERRLSRAGLTPGSSHGATNARSEYVTPALRNVSTGDGSQPPSSCRVTSSAGPWPNSGRSSPAFLSQTVSVTMDV